MSSLRVKFPLGVDHVIADVGRAENVVAEEDHLAGGPGRGLGWAVIGDCREAAKVAAADGLQIRADFHGGGGTSSRARMRPAWAHHVGVGPATADGRDVRRAGQRGPCSPRVSTTASVAPPSGLRVRQRPAVGEMDGMQHPVARETSGYVAGSGVVDGIGPIAQEPAVSARWAASPQPGRSVAVISSRTGP